MKKFNKTLDIKGKTIFLGGGGLSNKNKLKYIVSLLIVVVGILSLFGGTSYAILRGNTSSNNEQVIKTGSIEIKLTENFESINKKITVMDDTEGLLQEETYNFNIKNIGDAPAKFDLKLINDVPSDYTGKVLDTKYIKIGLEINGEEYGPMSLENVKNIIDSDVIYEKEMINYSLRIWLDKSKEEEILKLEDYTAFLKLKVEAEQRVEAMDKGVAKDFVYTGDTEKYIVPRDGYYKVELWGASGNNNYNSYTKANPSYGGYTAGEIYLRAGEKLFFNVGGMGKTFNCCSKQGERTGSGGATDVRVYENDKNPNNKFRYVRNYINGSSANGANHWVEVKVYDESGNNISQGKTVTYNGKIGSSYNNPSVVTDGDIATANYLDLGSSSENPYVEIDLGEERIISKVEVWHYFGDGRTYYNNKTELLTADKKESSIIYDSNIDGTYAETSGGKAVINKFFIQDLTSRIMVAGGSGGSYTDSSAATGGHAGGLTSYAVSHTSHPIYASNQTSGGAKGTNGTAGSFGFGGTNSSEAYNSGGGGYYGGGSGPGSGGGSSYISGHTGCVAVASSVSTAPKSGCTTGTGDNNCSIHYSNKVFTNTIMIDGAGRSWSNFKGGIQRMPSSSSLNNFYDDGTGQNGDGHARITLLNNDREYLYTNKETEFLVGKTGTYKVELWGASVKYVDNSGNVFYHFGSYTSGNIRLEEKEKLYLYVGEMGLKMDDTPTFNGGGSSSKGSYGSSGSQYYQNYPGGGATDVRLVGGIWSNSVSLASRIMVAAGSGGNFGSDIANGGGLYSNDTKFVNDSCTAYPTSIYYAYGASQIKAGYGSSGTALSGSFGVGGNGEVTSSYYGSSGGGGGYYGGGGGYSRSWQNDSRCSAMGGSGGSSYISGHTGCVAINSSSDITPKSGCDTGISDNSCSVHYSDKVFSNTKMIDGQGYSWTNVKGDFALVPNPSGGTYERGNGYPGPGYARITFIK